MISTKTLSRTMIFNFYEKYFLRQHFRMVSERLCDTKYWNKMLKIKLCRHRNTLYLKIYIPHKAAILNCNIVLQYYSANCILLN